MNLNMKMEDQQSAGVLAYDIENAHYTLHSMATLADFFSCADATNHRERKYDIALYGAAFHLIRATARSLAATMGKYKEAVTDANNVSETMSNCWERELLGVYDE